MNTFQNYNETESLIDIFPEILKMENFNDWNDFFSHVYRVFEKDFIETKPLFRGKNISFKRYPEYNEKSATFWHIISEGNEEAERIPCIKRCERINWARPMIENDQHNDLMIWIEKQKGEDRLHLFFEEGKYIVVLNKRRDSWLFWTAFYIKENHQLRKYNKRFERNKNIEIIL
jgi:hypothetical protein